MNNESLNDIWADTLIDQLIAQEVDYFCIAPGSRSTPLTLAIATHPKARHLIHYDERGMAFHALGYAKATKKPAVIVVTSGTAVGNLLPAVMEACYDDVPLIVLTADRPPELRECSANQTCNQVGIFKNFVRWEADLPCPSPELPPRMAASIIAHAVKLTRFPHPGPVHLNCMFREPLFSQERTPTPSQIETQIERPLLTPHPDTIAHLARELSSLTQGVILAGAHTGEEPEAIIRLAETLNWPIFVDILSPLRSYGPHPYLITTFDSLLKVMPEARFEAVLHFGARLTSKIGTQRLTESKEIPYIHISSSPRLVDPDHRVTKRIQCSPALLCNELIAALQPSQESGWIKGWQERNQRALNTLETFFSLEDQLSEPGIMRSLSELLTPNTAFFIANSMPIRDADQFLHPTKATGSIFGSRGQSGIDGNIATAVGIAQGEKKSCVAIMGDLTFLHDLNSLSQLKEVPYPVILCVINNGGGGIFSFLPVAKQKKHFETFVATAHHYHFKAAAELFELPYYSPKTYEELQEVIATEHFFSRSVLIEFHTDRAQNVEIHQAITQTMQQAESYDHAR